MGHIPDGRHIELAGGSKAIILIAPILDVITHVYRTVKVGVLIAL